MNIKKFYLYKFFSELIPIYPIYALLFESKGLTVSEISLLLAIWSVPVMILEIPSGILADRWSRKNMIVLSGVLKASCYFLWIFSEGFILFAAGFILWGISSCFHSGSEEALLYDSLLTDKRENDFDKILGRSRAISGIATVISSVSGGYLGMQFGMVFPLYLSVLSAMIAALVALTFKEINYYKDSSLEISSDEDKSTFKEAAIFLISNCKILIFTIMSITVVGMAGVIDEFDPLIAKSYGLSLNLIGLWVGIRFIFASFGSYLTNYIKRLFQVILKIKDTVYTISYICIAALVFIFLAGLIKEIWVMGLYGLFFMLMSAGEVLQEDYIQQKICDQGRSTVHSLISMAYNIYGILACLLVGFILNFTNVHGMLIVVAIFCIILTLILTLLYRTGYKKHNNIKSVNK